MLWTSIWILLVILWECYFCERCLFEFVILVIGILLWKLYHRSSSACKNIGWTLTYVWTLTIVRIELLLYDLILDEREGEHERWARKPRERWWGESEMDYFNTVATGHLTGHGQPNQEPKITQARLLANQPNTNLSWPDPSYTCNQIMGSSYTNTSYIRPCITISQATTNPSNQTNPVRHQAVEGRKPISRSM